MRENEGLVFHGTARAIRLINSLLDGKYENIPNIHRELSANFREFSRNESKISFPKFFADFRIFRKLSENSPRISRKIVAHEFYIFPKFSKNFNTILDNVRFQFCLAAESIEQDGPILPDDQPIKL